MGAGSAGCVVASRLSEEADVSVAVLEAGDDVNLHPAARVPLASFSLQKTRADWNYTTVSQKKALNAMKDNVSGTHLNERFGQAPFELRILWSTNWDWTPREF